MNRVFNIDRDDSVIYMMLVIMAATNAGFLSAVPIWTIIEKGTDTCKVLRLLVLDWKAELSLPPYFTTTHTVYNCSTWQYVLQKQSSFTTPIPFQARPPETISRCRDPGSGATTQDGSNVRGDHDPVMHTACDKIDDGALSLGVVLLGLAWCRGNRQEPS